MKYFLDGKEIKIKGTALMISTPAWGGYSPNQIMHDLISKDKEKDWSRQIVCVAGGLTNVHTDVKIIPKLIYCRKKKLVLTEFNPIVFKVVFPECENDRNILGVIQSYEAEADVLFEYIFDVDRRKMRLVMENIVGQNPTIASDDLKVELYKWAFNSVESVYLDYLRCYAINLMEFDEIHLLSFSNSTQADFPLMGVQNKRMLFDVLSIADQVNATDDEKCLVVLQIVKKNKRIKDVIDLELKELTLTGRFLLDISDEKVKYEAELMRKHLLPKIRSRNKKKVIQKVPFKTGGERRRKESYNEGVASHIGPESPVCASHAGRPVCVAAQAR
ncbi:MAG: hypothetical protein PHY48_16035 [Candidatus Cloacimonetes bacterium]|nr:hypothetical protein [Candidatus Cloacimonadota bacterium]